MTFLTANYFAEAIGHGCSSKEKDFWKRTVRYDSYSRKEIENEGLSDILDSKNNFADNNQLGGLIEDVNKAKKAGLQIDIDDNANLADQENQAQ